MVIISQAPAAAQITASVGGVFQSSVGGNLLLNAPGSARLEGRSFIIRASGVATLAAGTYTAAVTAILYGAKALAAPGAGNAIYSATASVVQSAAAATSVPFQVETQLEGDSISGLLQGRGVGSVNNALQALAAIGQAPTAVNFATEPPVQFAAGLTVASNATAVILDSFVLEA